MLIIIERERYLEQVIKERSDLVHQLNSVRKQAQDSIEYFKNANFSVNEQNVELQRSNKQLRETIQVCLVYVANLVCTSNWLEEVNLLEILRLSLKSNLSSEVLRTQ
jgi:hypothetical protein